MEPRIQYVKAEDGVSIAYWMLGQGGTPLLVAPPMGFSNLTLEWEVPKLRAWYEKVSRDRLLVRYDPRGQGMSDRGVADVSFEANEADFARIAGLVDRPMDVLAIGYQGLFGLALAARQPERVRRLVLLGCPVSGFSAEQKRQADALLSLAERDWNLALETIAHSLVGWSHGREAHDLAAFHKASISREDTLHAWREWQELPVQEVRSLLPAVQASTLVIDGNVPGVDRQAARVAASEIPNAQLLRMDEGWRLLHENERGMRAVEEFFSDGGSDSPTPVKADQPSGTAIILFADIVDSTALMERMGDAAFREKARDLDAALRIIIREHSGTPIDGKLLGDGVLAVFTSARQAIEAALACGKAGADGGLPLHLGIHAGDVIREENNVFGGAVNIAARISGLSAPGELLVSDIVRGLARTSAGVVFEDRGERELKGVGEPVRVFAVREGE